MDAVPASDRTTLKEFVSSVSPKGQITLPAEVRKQLGVKPKHKVAVTVEGQQVTVTPLGADIEVSYQAIPPLQRPVTEREMTDIAWEDHVEAIAEDDA